MNIEKKIIGFSVQEKKELEQLHEKWKRPAKLLGSTYKIKTPIYEHAVYITINDVVLNKGTPHESRSPFEVFINSKNMEHFQWAVALTLVISAVFRKGGDAAFLVEELKAVVDPKGGYFKPGGRFVPSLVSEIGSIIEEHMTSIGLIKTEELSEDQKKLIAEKKKEFDDAGEGAFPPSAAVCPACSVKSEIVLDGCKTCLNCGNSKCG